MERHYVIDGVDYVANINFRRRKGASLRLSADGKTFLCSASTFYRLKMNELDGFISRSIPKINRRIAAKKAEPDYQDGYLYLLGQKQYVGLLSEDDLETLLKKKALAYYSEKVPEYALKMKVKTHYRVRIRSMKTRFGVNSATTNTLTFSTHTICYSPDIIEALIVHELAHDFVRNHQKAFYRIVYQFDPDYDLQHKKLKKGIHA